MSGDSPPEDLEGLYARLADRDLSFAEIAELTDRQIVDILAHKRTETGEIADTPPSEELTGKEADRMALIKGMLLGIEAAELEKVWHSKYPGEPFYPQAKG